MPSALTIGHRGGWIVTLGNGAETARTARDSNEA